MEIQPEEEEKYNKIRQTIRRVILPLVQAIYNEDPADIISFCSGYFDGLLSHRENVEKTTDDLNSNYTGETSQKNEEGEINEALQTAKVSPSVQGSSSWNVTSNYSRSACSSVFSDCNIADVLSRIGDQPCSTVEKEENLECDVKSGDASISQKEEGKTLRSNNHIENDTPNQTMHKSPTKEVQNTHVLPSTLSEEKFEENNKELSEIHDDLDCENMNPISNIKEEEINKVSGNLKTNVSSSSMDQNSVSTEENKAPIKQLSPNSSFGFVPHLHAHEDELKKGNSCYYDDLNSKKRNNEEMDQLTKRLSDTLQSLAQEFSSAETNFDEKFQNAKEISDVVQGQHDTKEMNENNIEFFKDSGKDNEATNRGKENSNVDEENLHQDRDDYKNLVNTIDEPKFKESSENYLKKSPDSKTTEDSRCMSFQEVKNGTGHETRESSNFEGSEVHNLKKQKTNKEQSDSTLLHDNRRDDNRSENQEHRQTVDESWRRRWYEAHPRLDLESNHPRFFQGHQTFNANRRNGAVYGIGEAGDVCPDRRFAAGEGSNENLGCSLEPSHVVRSLPAMGENNSYSSLSSDEIRRRNIGRANRNFSDRDLTPNTSSQNVPYSWRQMCKPQACSFESDEKRFQSKTAEDKGILATENGAKKDLNANAHAAEPENLSEVVVVKEAEEKAKTESLNESQNTLSSKMDDNKEETNIHQRNKQHWRIINTMGTDAESFFRGLQQQGNLAFEQPEIRRNDNSLRLQQANIDDSYINRDMEMGNGYGASSVINKEMSESPRNDSSEKVEPGLISAGGDFASSEVDENDYLHPSSGVRGENSANTMEQNQAPVGGITAEYFEEIMGRVMEQQDAFKDTLESLNFSSYSESDKSSDYSETEADEFGLNSSV